VSTYSTGPVTRTCALVLAVVVVVFFFFFFFAVVFVLLAYLLPYVLVCLALALAHSKYIPGRVSLSYIHFFFFFFSTVEYILFRAS
jgi:hypothetical protein